MAVNLLVTLAIFTVSVALLNLEPPEFLGPYTDDPTRWPYGGCVEVSKIYPAPGSHLHPPADKYARYWDLNITVVFSRPVTRILWNYGIRTWLRNSSLNRDREVLSCAKKACLMVVHNGVYIYLSPKTAKPTERGKFFNDEFQFTFKVPTYVKDHVSEIHFALDGGLMYSPIYKFISNPHVEYVPYVAVRYLPPQSHSASRRPPERDTNYWVNYPSTCAARGGLIHRPSIFSRTKRKHEMATDNSPKLLTELTEIMTISNEGKRKLKLYYRLKQPGVYNVELPVSIKLLDKHTGLNISFSVPTVKSLVIDFSSPRVYIPVTTKYIFDYRERAYYEAPRWIAYLFTWKNVQCSNKTVFDCEMFDYSNKLPNPSSHNHQVTIRSLSDGYQLRGTPNYGLRLILYHQFRLPYDKQFHFIIPQNLFNRYELYSKFDNCYHNVYTTGPHYCYILGWNPHVREISGRNLSTLVLDPYWKLINIHDKYSGEVIDHIMISEELSKTIYASLGYLNKISNKIGGAMHHSATGSLYEKDMLRVIPLLNIDRKFSYQPKHRQLKAKCHGDSKRSVGKWGKLLTYIEHGNMYKLHVPKSSGNWTVQQTFKVRYNDNNGNQNRLTSAIVSFPEHIKRAVERYAALTNVQPNFYSATEKDTRLRTTRESYPLDKAVFVPQDLINKHGCGTLNITENDVSQISQYDWTCVKPPDDCTGLPFDSLDRFPLIPPFNVLDLLGPVDHIDTSKQRYKRALYYRDNSVNDLFILNTPNSHYTGVVEISGVEVEDPEFAEMSCNDLWKFSPERHEITKGHLMGTIINNGKGGSDVVVTVQCTPNLIISPEKATVWVDPRQTKIVRLALFLYPKNTKSSSAVYKCKISTTINVTPFKSAIGKTFPTCDLFIPTFGSSFVDPCEIYPDHEITYYHLPKTIRNRFLLYTIKPLTVGREYNLLTVISIKLIKYHIIRLSCDNSNILALTEDQLLFGSTNSSTSIDLIYSTDKLLQERVYIFKRKRSAQDLKTGCLLTLISIPFTSCGVLTRRYIILTKADQHAYATALQEREVDETPKKVVAKAEKSSWYRSISDRDDVLSAILVCTITSLIFIVFIVTGRSVLFIHDRMSTPTEKKMEQIKAEMQLAKQEHEETWNNQRMYLKSGMLGPYYDLHNFKATDALETADLKMLKLSGQLKYKDKVLQVVVEYIDEIVVKKTYSGEMPNEVWLKASTGMYLLKQSHASEEYKDEFNSILQRCIERNTIEY